MNKRRGNKKQFLSYFLFCLFISIIFGKNAFANPEIQRFLILPFSSEIRLLQGWEYTVLVRGNKIHGAIDYDCNLGDPIYASYDGVAMASVQVEKKSGAGYGNFVFIKHDNGYATLYGHLDKTAEYVQYYPYELRSNTNYFEWTPVKKGDYIGECGTSGTDNVHLHFEVTKGKYSTGRIDSYDLYKTKQFYPPNTSYTVLGEKHLWMSDPPQYLEAKIAENQSGGTIQKKKSILDTIKNWFAPDVISEEETKKNDQIEEGKKELGLSFTERKFFIVSHPSNDIQVAAQAKNTGSRVWKNQEISLNVIGGREANALFRHSTWITDLRPTLLDNTEVKLGETGEFNFTIKGLSPGSYTFRLMAVEVGTWKQIGDNDVTINMVISEPEKEVVIEESEGTKEINPIEGVVRGIKDFSDSVVEKVVEVFKSVPEFFGGGGGSAPVHSTEPTSSTEQNEEEEIEEVPSVEVNIEGSREIIFNEIAWSGSSHACTDHEWIELYNPSDIERSLENWTLEIDGKIFTLSGFIKSRGYFLIAHSDTLGSLVTADIDLPSTITLQDAGGELILKNESGVVVDSIKQNNGWFGGDTGHYPHTMERVSDMYLSLSSSTWKTSDSVRYGIASGSCGQITGSPGMENQGNAFISDETIGFYKDSEKNSVLSKENNPYIFSKLTIPVGEKLTIEHGTILVGAHTDAYITVQGELIIAGTEDDPSTITSRNDSEYVTSTIGEPHPGDWQNIVVDNTGKLDIQHARLKYGGNRYGVAISCQGCARSQVITNYGGYVRIENSEISNGYELGTSGKPDALIYSEGGTVEFKNVKLHDGKRALHSEGSAEIRADLLTLRDFDLLDKVIYFHDRMPSVWENIVFVENTPTYAYSPQLVVTSSYTLSPDTQFQFSTISISASGTLTMTGNNVYATEIKVNGNLTIDGGEKMSEISGGHSSSSTFSHILFSPGSSGMLSKVKVRGGGYLSGTSAYPFPSAYPFMIWIDGATVSITNSQLIDARRPGGVIGMRSGNLTISDSEIGWNSDYNKLYSWKEHGIIGNNQSKIRIENVNFRKMDYVVELNQNSTSTYDRMNKENFIDLYRQDFPQKNWFPGNVFPFQLW